ncbi:MAG TPA: NAD(P)H-binding protein, partial [Ramlibacter sp.]|nr:NAD(P)H-binding protein [Ramlibacter sp.]
VRPAMLDSPILVTGAAGKVGAIGPTVVKLLLERGERVRAMVRRADERSRHLQELGAEVVQGDLLDLHAVHRAVQGCGRVYFSMSVVASYLEATTNVAAVARHHGVQAFVNMSQMSVSQMGIRATTDSPQHKQHWLAEQVLRWSGLPVVTVRPTAFMDVFFLRFAAPGIRSESALKLPFGRGRTSPIAAHDVARVVAEILADPRPHVGQVYELTGPRCEDLDAIAARYAQVLNQPVRYVDVPPGPWEEQLRATAASPHLAAHLAAMAALHRDNRYDRLTDTVERLTGRPAMPIEAFIDRNASAFCAAHP